MRAASRINIFKNTEYSYRYFTRSKKKPFVDVIEEYKQQNAQRLIEYKSRVESFEELAGAQDHQQMANLEIMNQLTKCFNDFFAYFYLIYQCRIQRFTKNLF